MARNRKTIFEFNRGAYFSGMLEYTIREAEDGLVFRGCAFNGFYGIKDYDFSLPREAIKGLALVLKQTEKWKKNYEAPEEILDGYGWNIRFQYEDMKISTEGYAAFPQDYKEVIRQIQSEIEKLCREYSPDYTDEGIEERLSL